MTAERYEAFDLLATLVALARPDGTVLFANTGFEAAVGLSRRALARTSLFDHFTDPAPLRETLLAVARNEIATGRLEATLRVAGAAMSAEDLPVHVIVTQVEARGDARRPEGSELVLVEMLEVEQQTRQDREERALDQIEANRELIRNLAHEIKNPLGGIRGAAQLLAMELGHPSGRPRDDRSPRGTAAHGGQGAAGLPELSRVHRRHRARGRSPAGAGRPAAGAAPPAAPGGRRQHPRGVRTGALGRAGRVSAWPDASCATTTCRCRSSAATASS